MAKSQATKAVTISVPSDMLASIEAIAEATDRSQNNIVLRALKTYLLNEGKDILSANRGRQQIAAGDYEDLDDLISDLDKIVAEHTA